MINDNIFTALILGMLLGIGLLYITIAILKAYSADLERKAKYAHELCETCRHKHIDYVKDNNLMR